MRFLSLKGYFAAGSERPISAALSVTISGYGAGEQLTVDCRGHWRLTVPYRPIERLAGELRGKKDADELAGRLTGTDGGGRKRAVAAWMRRREGFEMLTLELEGEGQISAPFAPIETLIRAERRTQA